MKNVVWIIFVACSCLSGQDIDSLLEETWEIDGTIVEIKAKPNQQIFSVTSLSSEQMDLHIEPHVQSLLNQVSGIWMESGAPNTNRISIRGVGNREPFATSRLKVYLDEIPITDGLGETSMEDIDPSVLAKIQIWKNPSSSIWGAGLGGLMHLQTETQWDPEYTGSVQIGSFGRIRTVQQLKHNLGKSGNAPFLINYNLTNQDGYRDNNDYKKHNLFYLQRLKISDNWSMQLLGLYIDLNSQIPSSLGITDFTNEPSKAAFTWGRVQGFEDYTKGIFGVAFKGLLSDKLIWHQSYAMNSYKSDELRPFNILEESRLNFTIRQRLSWQLDSKTHVQLGIEWFKEGYDWTTSLDEDGVENILTDQEENHITLNAFLQAQHQFNERLYGFLGLNLNTTNYDISSLLNTQTLDYQYDPVVNPSFGLGYSVIKDKFHLITSFSKGFNPINIEDALNSTGLLNPDLKPESGWSFDVGGRWTLPSFTGSLNVYSMNISNLLVQNRISEDVFESINAGQTRHQGIELEYKFKILDDLDLKGSYAFNNHKFVDYINGENDYSGNPLTGSSKARLFHLISYHPGNFSLNLQHWSVGKTPIRDDNTLHGDAYQIVNLQLRYSFPIKKQWTLQFTGLLNNILNTDYASMFLINATGFGNSEPRYYYPGLPRNWVADLQINYKF